MWLVDCASCFHARVRHQVMSRLCWGLSPGLLGRSCAVFRGGVVLSSVEKNSEQEQAGYTVEDLEWLQLQFRLRHAIVSANPPPAKCQIDAGSETETSGSTLAHLFGGVALTNVISDAEKLRRARARRQRYLEVRVLANPVDLLLRLRSNEAIFAHTRQVESKGLS